MKIFLGTVTFLALFYIGLAYPRNIPDLHRDSVATPDTNGETRGGSSVRPVNPPCHVKC
ncbi:hypothetical protein PTTW11_00004 [Pyrenophora teres f. teres]|uniref:Uncharacterized protein n=1 Tax=Pyrenophora teres f. teres TaxID=97479 RepID=A0A6S6VTU1_9PLEO|nr:hypothetical protein PTTW11_00004 [Pyrenophora teres f. teres]